MKPHIHLTQTILSPKGEPTGRVRVVFSGSLEAYRIWQRAHAIPDRSIIEKTYKKGPSGRGAGRVLQSDLQPNQGSGRGGSGLRENDHGCWSTKKGLHGTTQ